MRNPWAGLWRDIVLNTAIASPLVPMFLRWRLLRAYGMNIDRSQIAPGVWFGSHRMTIGEGSFVNRNCMFTTSAPISIGRGVFIGMRTLLNTTTHEIGGPEQRAGDAKAAPIVIGDGTWIGAGVVIDPGVTIGAGVVVASGAVVTGDCAPNGFYAGVPAVLKRAL